MGRPRDEGLELLGWEGRECVMERVVLHGPPSRRGLGAFGVGGAGGEGVWIAGILGRSTALNAPTTNGR